MGIPLKSAPEWTVYLSLVTAVQYKDHLTDRQAAKSSSLAVPWIYPSQKSQEQPVMCASLLCCFRQRLFDSIPGQGTFQQFLNFMEQVRFIHSSSLLPGAPLEAMDVLISVCMINRAEFLMETLLTALERLAMDAPEWLKTVALPHWFSRYFRIGDSHPRLSLSERNSFTAVKIGIDIHHLLASCEHSGQPALSALPEVQRLRRALEEQFVLHPEEDVPELRLQWREGSCIYFDGHREAVPDFKPCYEHRSSRERMERESMKE